MRRGAGRLALVAALAWPGVAASQDVVLGPPLAVHPGEFALVNGVRELSDGRVLVADPLGMTLLMLSPDLMGATPLGREGEGPNEYGQPDAVWPMPGDSTLLVDLGNARLTVLDAGGVFTRTRPILLAPFDPGRGGLSMMLPRGVDAQGRIYFDGARQGPGGAMLDSIAVLRYDPYTEVVDTVARVRAPATRSVTTGGAGNQEIRVTPVPLGGADGWAVAPGGAVGVARLGDYRVEWADAGAVRRGAPVPYEPVAIGRAEREEWAEDQQRNAGIGVGVEIVNGEVSVSMGRRGGQPSGDLARLPWPEYKPPFVPASVRADPDGRLWVQRSREAGAPRLYDVFDTSGRHLGSVEFPQGRQLVGFGRTTLYAVAVGAFDLLTLERYARPAW